MRPVCCAVFAPPSVVAFPVDAHVEHRDLDLLAELLEAIPLEELALLVGGVFRGGSSGGFGGGGGGFGGGGASGGW